MIARLLGVPEKNDGASETCPACKSGDLSPQSKACRWQAGKYHHSVFRDLDSNLRKSAKSADKNPFPAARAASTAVEFARSRQGNVKNEGFLRFFYIRSCSGVADKIAKKPLPFCGPQVPQGKTPCEIIHKTACEKMNH
ncbi:MAG: hypothetical protein QM796_01195 [Chthoniobacteraceae bacterium]